MKYTICSHSIYRVKPENPLDDLSCSEFKSLINNFDITFDDGYRSIYKFGKVLFNNVKNNIYLFINPEFIEKKSTVWWFELYDLINKENDLNFVYKYKKINLRILKKSEKRKAYIYLSNIFKYLYKKEQESLLTDLKNSNARNDYKDLFLTWDMIRELSSFKNVIIGSHTCSHTNLKILNDNFAKSEIKSSKIILEDKLNCIINDIAIPYGDKSSFSNREFYISNQAGYKNIFTTTPKIFSGNNKYKRLKITHRICSRGSSNNIMNLFIRIFIKSILNIFNFF